MMNKKFLNIILNEDISFKDIKTKIESAFGLTLKCSNQDGRLIAKGNFHSYIILLIDRHDDLGDFLCDENYILRIETNYSEISKYDKIENQIINYLKNNQIKWIKGVWRPTKSLTDIPRTIFP